MLLCVSFKHLVPRKLRLGNKSSKRRNAMNKEESDVYETWEFSAQYPASDQRSRSNSCQSSSSSSSSSLSSSSSRQSSEGGGSLDTVTELEFYGSVKFRDSSTLREQRDAFTEDDDNYDDVYNSLDSGDSHTSYSSKLREQSSFFFQS